MGRYDLLLNIEHGFRGLSCIEKKERMQGFGTEAFGLVVEYMKEHEIKFSGQIICRVTKMFAGKAYFGAEMMKMEQRFKFEIQGFLPVLGYQWGGVCGVNTSGFE